MNPAPTGETPENNQDEGSWHPLGHAEDLEDDKGKAFTLPSDQGEDLNIAVFRHQGEYYALEDRCTHAKIPLVDGPVKDGCLVCPWHYAEFDLKTGAALSAPAVTAVKTFEIRLNPEGMIEIKV